MAVDAPDGDQPDGGPDVPRSVPTRSWQPADADAPREANPPVGPLLHDRRLLGPPYHDLPRTAGRIVCPVRPGTGHDVSVAELSVEGWLTSVARLADEADVDPHDVYLGPLEPFDAPSRRLVARCRPDQEPR